MAEENKSAQSIKVTDKRLFTPEGEIREEYRQSVRPADPDAPRREPPPEAKSERAAPPAPERQGAEGAAPSETLFMGLIELLVYQAAMSLQAKDVAGARQIIDIVDMLADKTAGNLTDAESQFLEARRGELKLAYVQRTKRI